MSLLKALFWFWQVVFISEAFAGGATSNGGELYSSRFNPWFVGDEPFTYCIIQGEHFSQDEGKAREDVATALRLWAPTVDFLNPESAPNPFPDGMRKKLTRWYTYHEECTAKTELRFYFGTTPPEVARVVGSEFEPHVMAFAKMTHLDMHTGRGKGFVWLGPDLGPKKIKHPHLPANAEFHPWSKGATLPTLLHELGHVFGFGHNFGGLMDSHYVLHVSKAILRDENDPVRRRNLSFSPTDFIFTERSGCLEQRFFLEPKTIGGIQILPTVDRPVANPFLVFFDQKVDYAEHENHKLSVCYYINPPGEVTFRIVADELGEKTVTAAAATGWAQSTIGEVVGEYLIPGRGVITNTFVTKKDSAYSAYLPGLDGRKMFVSVSGYDHINLQVTFNDQQFLFTSPRWKVGEEQ